MNNSTLTNKKGFSLVETLIALMIMAFGVLAVATMIDVSFSAGDSSRNMTNAVGLATYMMDRIRAEAMSTSKPFAAETDKLQTFSMDTNSATGPAAEPGKTAFQEWQALLRANVTGLPGGRGVVTISQVSGAWYSITVQVTWSGQLLTRRGAIVTTNLTL